MRPQFLLNFSTHERDLSLFSNDWSRVREFVEMEGFDGIELYPVASPRVESIPEGLVKGVHLRFFIMLRPIWSEDVEALKETFGSLEDAKRFYGGEGVKAIIKTYRRQLDLAQALGASYVVYHPTDVALENVFDWAMDHSWEDTIRMCCEIIQEAVSKSSFMGYILFENLWWPGGFTLESLEEYEFIRENMSYERCGIVLDTGHLLLQGGGFDMEKDAISYLLKRASELSEIRASIIATHLTCTLSGEYVRRTRGQKGLRPRGETFWERLAHARTHVLKLDRHDPFTDGAIKGFLKSIDPKYVVFEFRYEDMAMWRQKILSQKNALKGFM